MFKKGYTPWNKDKKLSKEHKESIGKAHKGLKRSEETKKKMSINNGRYWKDKKGEYNGRA